MNGTDPRKKWQRNIRIEDELWDYVRSIAIRGNCSSVIRKLIQEKKHRNDASILAGIQRAERRKARKAAKAVNIQKERTDGHGYDHSPTDTIVGASRQSGTKGEEASALLPR